MTKLSIKIEPVGCQSCFNKIERRLIKTDGLDNIIVNRDEFVFTFDIDQQQVNEKDVINSINDMGYTVIDVILK